MTFFFALDGARETFSAPSLAIHRLRRCGEPGGLPFFRLLLTFGTGKMVPTSLLTWLRNNS